MYCCDTGEIPALDVQKMTRVSMSVEEALRISHELDTVRNDPEDGIGNGEINIVIVGRMIKKIRTAYDRFYENFSKQKKIGHR